VLKKKEEKKVINLPPIDKDIVETLKEAIPVQQPVSEKIAEVDEKLAQLELRLQKQREEETAKIKEEYEQQRKQALADLMQEKIEKSYADKVTVYNSDKTEVRGWSSEVHLLRAILIIQTAIALMIAALVIK
jgi:predicted RNA-binding protein with RPS1 domain